MKKLLKPFINTPWYDKVIACIFYFILLCFFISFLFGVSVIIYKHYKEILIILAIAVFFLGAMYISNKYHD